MAVSNYKRTTVLACSLSINLKGWHYIFLIIRYYTMINRSVNCKIRTRWNLFWPKIFIIEHCFQTKFFISDLHTILQHMSHILNKTFPCFQNVFKTFVILIKNMLFVPNPTSSWDQERPVYRLTMLDFAVPFDWFVVC